MGLEQGRVAGLHFDVAVFTNLTRDHLDYHGSMSAYGTAKSKLFSMQGLKSAVINSDDEFSSVLVRQIADGVSTYFYSISAGSEVSADSGSWITAHNVRYHSKGVQADMKTPWGSFQIESPLLGEFNLSNLLAALTSLAALGVPMSALAQLVPQLSTVPGRMELVRQSTDIAVIVDYAHTPDALEKALLAVKQHSDGDMWCVFGCGGDRDQGKRPQMGEIAARHADHVVVTSDNPRGENPVSIIDEILGGVDRPSLVEVERDKAITFAIENAKPGDSVLIAGKGHENYQLIGQQKLPFSDMNCARLALSLRAEKIGGAQ